jgi:hypothetical protein
METMTNHRLAWRGRAGLFAASLLVCTAHSAQAAKLLPGYFTGNAFATYADISTGVLSLELTHFAHANCPCAGTNGHAVVSRVGPLGVPGLVGTNLTVARVIANRTATDAQATESSHLEGVSLLGGLISATAIKAVANVHATDKTLHTSSTGSVFTNLVVAGQKMPANVPENTVVQVPGLGSVTLNAVTASGDGTTTAGTSVVMIKVLVAETNNFGLPVGARLVVGEAAVAYDRKQPHRIVQGSAYAADTNATAVQVLPGLGPLAPVEINNCAGVKGVASNQSAAVTIGPISIGAGTSTAQGGRTGRTTSAAQTTSTVAGVSLLGLIGASSITSVASETVDKHTVTASSAGTQFAGLSILGQTLPVDVPANTQIPLPLLGYVVVNEQIGPKPGHAGAMTVNGLHVYITTANLQNLPVGAEIIVAHATATAAELPE